MHAITSLLSGIRGAEGGYARIYARGTTTRATVYSTFEGDSADSSGDDINLDDNGGAEVYVSELVDVVVLDSDGAEVRRFTDGYASGSIEVRSQSFTGADYEDASAGAGSNYPTTLQAILDLWKDKAGAIDWDVLIGGQTETLLEVVSRLAGPAIFNVKSSAYGALGDGATDDTVAIGSAMSDAEVAGGIVFFPAGTYLISSALTVTGGVSLVGVGAHRSLILTNHATANGLVYQTSNSFGYQQLCGLRIGAQQSNTGIRVYVDGGVRLRIDNCFLGGSNTNGNALQVATATTDVAVVDSVLSTPSATAVLASGSGKRIRFVRCKFIASAASYTPAGGDGMVDMSTVDFIDCTWDASACTAGTIPYYQASSTTLDATMRGCRFLASGGATVTAITLGSYTATSRFEESESYFGASVTAYSYTAIHAGNSKGALVKLNTRVRRRYEVTDNTATITSLPWDQYGIIVLIRGTNADQTVNMFNTAGFATVPPDGEPCFLVYRNSSGGAIANLVLQVYNPLVVATHTTIGDLFCLVLDFVSFVRSGTLPGIACSSVTDEQQPGF